MSKYQHQQKSLAGTTGYSDSYGVLQVKETAGLMAQPSEIERSEEIFLEAEVGKLFEKRFTWKLILNLRSQREDAEGEITNHVSFVNFSS